MTNCQDPDEILHYAAFIHGLHWVALFFPLIVAFSSTTVQIKVLMIHTKDVCSFIAYCVIEFKTVFPSLIFVDFCFYLQ